LKLHGINFTLNPNINFKIRSVSVLGTANKTTNTISLNKGLYEEYNDIYLKEVLLHELAHLVVDEIYYGAKPHGREFKHICSLFGISGKASTSAFEGSKTMKNIRVSKRRNQKKFSYTCGCKTHEVSTTIHNRISKGSKYVCPRCKGFLVKV